MHLALTFVVSVLFISHVQSSPPSPDRCQMYMKAMTSIFQQTAQLIDKERYPHLHARVSGLAIILEIFNEAKRQAEITGASGSSQLCRHEMTKFSKEVEEVEKELNDTEDETLTAAKTSISEASKLLQKMGTHPKFSEPHD